MNRLKNGLILIILISFLCFVSIMPVKCAFLAITGIYCPACGMTRAFLSIWHFDFLEACYQNLLSIPFFLFLVFFIFMLVKDFIKNCFSFIPKLLSFLGQYTILILFLLFISFLFNNLKVL